LTAGSIASMLAFLLLMPPITAYLALNFTGATPFPSRTGVRKEIFTYIPVMAVMVVLGVIDLVAMVALSLLKVI